MSETTNCADARIKALLAEVESIANRIEPVATINCLLLNGERFVTDEELSQALRISKRTLLEYRNQGKLAYYYFGGKILYAESDILKILNDNRHECWG